MAATIPSDLTDEESDELHSESDTDSESELQLTEPKKNPINNKEGLLSKLEDFQWPKSADFIDRLTVDHDQQPDIDVNDDLAREFALYSQALDGARRAFEKMESLKIPFLRPPDYYAEMVKTDSHMLKIKGKALVEKKKMEEAEERRKAREAKKISKEVQAQKNKERAKSKKESIESVKKFRKQRKDSGFEKGKGEDFDLGFEKGGGFDKGKKKRPGVGPGDRSGGFRKGRGGGQGNRKREGRDSKFGQGGRKGMRKQNTAETTNDIRGFNQGGSSSSGNRKRKR